MDTTGLAYVPAACATVGGGGKCRLHVALHGCAQAREAVGDVFASRTGYNGWAETNRIVVLYPQAAATLTNPQGCWDWYGFRNGLSGVKSPECSSRHRCHASVRGRHTGRHTMPSEGSR